VHLYSNIVLLQLLIVKVLPQDFVVYFRRNNSGTYSLVLTELCKSNVREIVSSFSIRRISIIATCCGKY